MAKKTLGIVSGGQLGRMLTEPAIKLGLDVLVLDPTPNCPAAQVGAKQIIGSWKDRELLGQVVEQSDFFTIEIEHIDTKTLKKFKNKKINPHPKTIELIQNKLEQKKLLQKNGIAVGEFDEITSWDDVIKKLEKWDGKLYLKKKYDAYDGRGNWFFNGSDQIKEFSKFNKSEDFYIEKLIRFKREIAVIVAKDINGNIKSYPATETIHKRNICVETHTPTGLPAFVDSKAIKLAEGAVSLLDGAGIYGVEMFLTEFDDLMINEIAPRVHNSGHYTMDACETSQFEQHVRAVTGMKLGSTKMKVPAAVMINILGERDGQVKLNGVEEAEKIDGVSVYIYGKSPTKIDRKMGHINAIGDTIEAAREKALKARRMISI